MAKLGMNLAAIRFFTQYTVDNDLWHIATVTTQCQNGQILNNIQIKDIWQYSAIGQGLHRVELFFFHNLSSFFRNLLLVDNQN